MHKEAYAEQYRILRELQTLGYNVVRHPRNGDVHLVRVRRGEDASYLDMLTGEKTYENDSPDYIIWQNFMDDNGFLSDNYESFEMRIKSLYKLIDELEADIERKFSKEGYGRRK